MRPGRGVENRDNRTDHGDDRVAPIADRDAIEKHQAAGDFRGELRHSERRKEDALL
jgi:hypothetical protein